MNDTAASLQIAYDKAVHEHGPDSIEAHDAERAARNYFNQEQTCKSAKQNVVKRSTAPKQRTPISSAA
jgi:hypothetical protein